MTDFFLTKSRFREGRMLVGMKEDANTAIPYHAAQIDAF